MKKKNNRNKYAIGLGGMVAIAMISLIATSFSGRTYYKMAYTAKEAHGKLVANGYVLAPGEVKDMLANPKANVVLVDIRNPRNYDNYHIEGAINIPMQSVLETEWRSFFGSESKKILYCSNAVKASEVWLLLTQYGVKNLYVLDGGANYWINSIETKDVFASDKAGDEAPLYDLEEIKQLKSGEPVIAAPSNADVPAPQKRKKKTVQGGCS